MLLAQPQAQVIEGKPQVCRRDALIFNSAPSPSCEPDPRPEEPPWSKMVVRTQHLQQEDHIGETRDRM